MLLYLLSSNCKWPWKKAQHSWLVANTVKLKNFHGSSDICPMGFIYSIQICEISHQIFGPSHQKCLTCPMIFVNTAIPSLSTSYDIRSFPQVVNYICASSEFESYRWYCLNIHVFNSLFPSNAMWWHRSRSTMAQVMACCLMAPSLYLNQCCSHSVQENTMYCSIQDSVTIFHNLGVWTY